MPPTTPRATLSATVVFSRRPAGRHAGVWTIPSRRGEVRPQLGSTPNHDQPAWAVSVATDRAKAPCDDHETEIKTVTVWVPWRLSYEPLSEEERRRVLDLAREQVGEYEVITR